MIPKKEKFKKGSWQKIFLSVLILFFALGVVGFLALSNLRINQKRASLLSQIETLEKEIQILGEKNEKLRAGISQTEKESYLESKIREQGFVKEGETPVVVKPMEESNKELPEEQKNIFQKFWGKLGF